MVSETGAEVENLTILVDELHRAGGAHLVAVGWISEFCFCWQLAVGQF